MSCTFILYCDQCDHFCIIFSSTYQFPSPGKVFWVVSMLQAGPIAEQLQCSMILRSQQTSHSFQEAILVLRVHGLVSVQLKGEGCVA